MSTDGRTIWLLDVDGVLNAPQARWSQPAKSEIAYAGGLGWKLRWAPELLARIDACNRGGKVEVKWASTWCDDTDELHRVFGIGPFPPAFVSSWEDGLPWHERKVEAALAVLAAGDRLIWTDDTEVGPVRSLPEFEAAESEFRALLIAPNSSRGLRPWHMKTIEKFAELD